MDKLTENPKVKLLVMLAAAGAVVLAVLVLFANNSNTPEPNVVPKPKPVETPDEITTATLDIDAEKKNGQHGSNADVQPSQVAPNASVATADDQSAPLSTQPREDNVGTTEASDLSQDRASA